VEDRFETDAFLQRHHVEEQSLGGADVKADRTALRQVLDQAASEKPSKKLEALRSASLRVTVVFAFFRGLAARSANAFSQIAFPRWSSPGTEAQITRWSKAAASSAVISRPPIAPIHSSISSMVELARN
jgi:hypothetical protein